MFNNIHKLYPKYIIYIILLLIIGNIIAFIHPQLIHILFEIIKKLFPQALIHYFENSNLTINDVLYLFTISLTITGFTTIWYLIFNQIYFRKKYIKRLEENPDAKYPKFHMNSIYYLTTEISSLLFLIILLLIQTKFTSASNVKIFFYEFLLDNIFISILTIFGIGRVCFICFILVYSGLGTASRRAKE